MARIASGHHVLGIKHLLGQPWDGQRPVLLATTRGQRGETGHEKVETRERHHVDSQLSQVRVELAREAKAGGDT